MQQTNASGVKIYGKRGRRIRAKERLESQLRVYDLRMKKAASEKNLLHFYKEHEKDINRIKKELETLKSRI